MRKDQLTPGVSSFPLPPSSFLSIAALSHDACASIRADVLALRDRWSRRERTPRFHTLGRSVDLDGSLSAEEFAAATKRANELLRERFASVYDALTAALSRLFDAPVRFREPLPRPGFLILGDEPGATLPIAPVRCDYAPLSLRRGSHWPAPPFSFVLPIALERETQPNLMSTWPLDAEATTGLDTDEVDRLLDGVLPRHHTAAVGELLVFPSLLYHQPAPLAAPGGQRITLEGRAFRTETSWELYW
jgi:hypothetical protein